MSAEGWAAPGRGLVRQFHYWTEGARLSLCARHVDLGTTPRLDEVADLVECESCRESVNRLAGKRGGNKAAFVGAAISRGRGWR